MAKKKDSGFSEVLAKFSVKKAQVHVEVRPDVFNNIWKGVHLGAVYSLWGAPGCGKSTLMMQVCRSMLKQGYKGVIVDVEKAINNNQQENFGLTPFVESEDLFLVTCTNFKEFEEVVLALPGSGMSFIAVDSLTMIRAYVKDDLTVEDIRPGIKSLQESAVLNKLKDICYSNDIACFLLNHARANIQIAGPINRYAPAVKSAGGFAVEHIPDVITKIQAHSKIKGENDEPIGVEISLVTEKNKYTSPFQVVKEKLIYGKGIDPRISIIERAIEQGVITQSGAYFTVPGMDANVKGRSALYEIPNEVLASLRKLLNEE